jgi:signal transduction histidine kinase
VILADAMMPNVDGFELVARLRQSESTADIPVIMLSARAGEESRIEGLSAGADDYLVKPFSARELLARVRVHVTLAQLRRKLLERAVGAQSAAEDATRAKDEFLAMLGHELRNPLSPIVTAVGLLKRRGVNGKEIEIIERQLRQVVRLVDDLMDVSRITRGKVDLHVERVTLADVLTRAIETTSPLLEQRHHPFVVDVPEALVVNADPSRLAQVFANLLTNASKYSDPGTEIRVSARASGDRVDIRVADRGIGVQRDLLERVFDPLRRTAAPCARRAPAPARGASSSSICPSRRRPRRPGRTPRGPTSTAPPTLGRRTECSSSTTTRTLPCCSPMRWRRWGTEWRSRSTGPRPSKSP